MLSDIERKVLLIIRNSLHIKDRSPTIREIMTRTGRTEKRVFFVLQSLNQKEYIRWSWKEPERIILIDHTEPRGHWEWD